MFQRILWAVFRIAAAALFALVAAFLLFVAWVFVGELQSGAPQPWGAIGSAFRAFFAPIFITAGFAFWHLRRHRRTGQRSALVETGVSIIGLVSVAFVVGFFAGS